MVNYKVSAYSFTIKNKFQFQNYSILRSLFFVHTLKQAKTYFPKFTVLFPHTSALEISVHSRACKMIGSESVRTNLT